MTGSLSNYLYEMVATFEEEEEGPIRILLQLLVENLFAQLDITLRASDEEGEEEMVSQEDKRGQELAQA